MPSLRRALTSTTRAVHRNENSGVRPELSGPFHHMNQSIFRTIAVRQVPTLFLALAFAGALQAQSQARHALRFDGTNDWCYRTGVPSARSFEAILRVGDPSPTTPSYAAALLSQHWAPDVCNHGADVLVFPTRALAFGVDIPNCRNSSYAISPPVGESWIHVAATFDGAVQRIYVDGVLQGQMSNTTPTWYTGLALGGDLSGRWYLGAQFEICEVRLWSRGLSAAEVQAHLSERSVATTDPDLIAMYFFYEGSGQVVHDVTGHGWDLRLGTSTGVDAADPTWVAAHGATPFGSGCSGSGSCTPWISATGPIHAGVSSLNVLLGNALGASAAVLIIGIDESPNVALPIRLSSDGLCLLQVAPQWTMATLTTGTGACSGTASQTLPLSVTLPAGFDFTLQWVTLDPQVSGLGLAASGALAVRL